MDSSVKLAIESAGGVSALARQLGIAHTSVLDWSGSRFGIYSQSRRDRDPA